MRGFETTRTETETGDCFRFFFFPNVKIVKLCIKIVCPMITTVIYSELLIIVNIAPKSDKVKLLFLPIILWKINTNRFFKQIYSWDESCSLKTCIQIIPNHSASYTICPKLTKNIKITPTFGIQNGRHFQGGIIGKCIPPKNNAQIISIQMVHTCNLHRYLNRFKKNYKI